MASRDRRDRDDEDEAPKGSSKSRGRDRDADAEGVSLEQEDATSGLFGPGPATIKESIFAPFNYGGTSKNVPVWLIVYERDGDTYEQPYSVGDGWKISADGESLIPRGGQKGLSDSCNAMKYLIAGLRAAEKRQKLPKFPIGNNPRRLEGMEVILARVAQEKREGLDDDREDDRGRGKKKERSILVIDEIVSVPEGEGDAKPKASKRKAARDEDEEETEKTSAKRTSRKSAPVDDDDEDEAPAKGKGKSAGKGKAEPEATDDDAIREQGVEALIEVLEKAGRAVDVDALEGKLAKVLKGNDDADPIIELVITPDFLAEEMGWSFDKRKQLVELDK